MRPSATPAQEAVVAVLDPVFLAAPAAAHVADDSPAGAWEWDLLDDSITRTDGCCTAFGRDAGSFPADVRGLISLIHPDDQRDVMTALSTALECAAPFRTTYRVVWPDGSLHWLEDQAVVFQRDGRPVRLVCIVSDVTRRMAARESADHAIRLVDSIADGFCAVDSAERLTYVNARLARAAGCRPDIMVGRRLSDVCPDLAGPALQLQLRRALDEARSVYFEGYVAAADAWYGVHMYPAGDGGAALYFTDVTVRRREAESAAATIDRLRHALYESSHRIKNHLQILAAVVDLQVMSGAHAVPIETLRKFSAQVRALAAVHDILTEQAQSGAAHGAVGAVELIEPLLYVLEQTMRRPIRCTVAHSALPARSAAAVALLLNELVNNAVKHGGESAEVVFAVGDGHARLVVSDDGPGFPPGFDPRAAANTGLELIDHLTRFDLCGSATFENAPGGGARVTIAFPLSAAAG